MKPLLACLILTGLLSSAYANDEVFPEQIKENAYKIDKLVAENFKKNKIAVPEVTDDSTFLRRAFLVSVGRIPTPKEALQFLELEHPEKREMLIDYLYSSPGYKSHFTNYLYDLLTLREYFGFGSGRTFNAPLIDWVRDSVEVNKPWDDFCKELISSRGNAWVESGAAGYHHKGDALDDHLSNTLRIFTGVRMECAQCHDDPFQEWEQMDFYQFKAFVDGNSGYHTGVPYGKLDGEFRLYQGQPEKAAEFLNTSIGSIEGLHGAISSKVQNGITEKKGRGRVQMPLDYQYNDADPGEVVEGKTAFGARLKTKDDKDDPEALDKFAAWMVSDDTPQFAQTISMRLWERVMGISLTPVTGDYIAPEETEFRSLINYLSSLIKEYDYDVKVFQKTLMRTKTFQFVSSKKDLLNGEKTALDGRRSSRMSAEQIWDSLLSLSVMDPDALPKRKRKPQQFNYAGQHIMPVRDLVEKVRVMNYEQYKAFIYDTFKKLKNKEFPEAKEEAAPLVEEKMMSLSGMDAASLPQGLRRASELPTPVPSGHFLATFGQSTRQAAIDEATKEGTVSQALEMLNGEVQRMIVENDQASINQVIDHIKDDEQRIRTIFLVVLNRAPDAEELQMGLDLINISENTSRAYRNLIAGLISSQEFYFIF